MKKTEAKKLELNLETLRNLKPEELGKVVGGARYYTQTEVASGCAVTEGGCGGGYSVGWC